MIRKLLVAVALVSSIPMGVMAQGADDVVSGGLIVKLKPSAREGALLSSVEQDARRQRLARLASSAGYTSTTPWRNIGGRTAVLKTPSGLNPRASREVLARLVATGEVEWVEPNVRQKLLASSTPPNDPYYVMGGEEGQWWLKRPTGSNTDSKATRQRGVPNILAAWATTPVVNPSSGVVIAVLDTGHTPHPDIDESRILPGYDFVSETLFDGDGQPGRDSDPRDPGDGVSFSEAQSREFKQLSCPEDVSSWHGLAITAILAANTNNGKGVAGISPSARVLPVRVAGKCGAELDDIVDAMRWAAGLRAVGGVLNPNPAKIINISFGGDQLCGPTYQEAIDELKAAGVVVVAAGGNEHSNVSRPANCKNVVAVAALNREGFKASYSNFGPQVTVSTVGGDPAYAGGGRWDTPLSDKGLLTAYDDTPGSRDVNVPTQEKYFYVSGSSFAAPVVAGVISLMLDVNPGLTPDQIRDGLKLSARPHVTSDRIGACSSANPGRCICTKATCGEGILDAAEAVRFAQGGYVQPFRLAQNIDSASVISALSLAPQDLAANAPSTTSDLDERDTRSGGGGAIDAFTALGAGALALLLAAQGWASRRAHRKGLGAR